MASLKAGGKLASKGNVDGVARWIEQRVKQHGSLDVGAVNGSGDTMLHLAARHGHARVLELLLAQGPSKDEVNARNTVGHTPLHEAALCSDSTCVQLLLAAGADVHIAKHADWTALHLAATKPNANAVQQLLAAGADATRLNKDGWTPMHIACKTGCEDVVRVLHDAFSEGARIPSRTQRTPLMTAATHNHNGVVKLLLEWLDPTCTDATDSCGWTALAWAVAAGARTCVHLLLDHGSDPAHCDHEGRSIIHIAAMAGLGSENFKTTEADALHILDLLTAKCPQGLNQPDHHGLTPLHLAAMHGHAEHVSHLIAVGADATKADIKGRTPLDLARARRKDNTAAVLEACSS